LISWENTLSTYEEKSVGATFTALLDDLERQSPDVTNLLKVLSFFDPESIPLDMITQGANALSLPLIPSTAMSSDGVTSRKTVSLFRRILLRRTKQKHSESVDVADRPQLKPLLHLILSPVQLQNAIMQLQNRSLVKQIRSADTSVLHIHDLIKIMVQASLTNSGTDREWFDIAVDLAWSAFQLVEDPESYKCWPRCAVFTPHFHLLTMQGEIYGSQSMPILKANWKIARYLWSSGRYKEAETLLGRTLATSEKQLGVEHPDTLGIMHQLAVVYRGQGRYEEAEIQYKHVLALREKRLGLGHPDTLHTMHNLAVVYHFQGRYSEAETQYKHVFALTEKQLGSEHPDTLHTMHGLALVYNTQGRYSEAETQYKHVLALTEKQRGSDHPDTLRIMHNLAVVYDSQGRHNEAEALYKRELMLTEKQIGSEHPDTLVTMHNLALVYNSQGRHSEAEALFKHVLMLREKQIGSEHPNTLNTMACLASVYESLDRSNEAEALRKRVNAIRERKLAKEHPGPINS
jgi:tetratricopeptide (TPR) repeat protein